MFDEASIYGFICFLSLLCQSVLQQSKDGKIMDMIMCQIKLIVSNRNWPDPRSEEKYLILWKQKGTTTVLCQSKRL